MTLPFTRAQIAALEQLVGLWQQDHRFVLIGAAAISCHRPNPRGSQDLDLVLAVSLESLPAGLDTLPGWQRHPTKLYEWHGPNAVNVDILPADHDLLARGYLEWPDGRRMNLAGIEHAFARHQSLRLSDSAGIDVARLEVLALLKIVSFLDRPTERQHDLEDLAFLMDEYLLSDDERRWCDDVINQQIPMDRVASYLLGKDIGTFAKTRDRACIEHFVRRLRDDGDPTRGQMSRLAPGSWRRSEDEVLDQFLYFEQGLRNES